MAPSRAADSLRRATNAPRAALRRRRARWDHFALPPRRPSLPLLVAAVLSCAAPGARAQPESMDASGARWFSAEAQAGVDSTGASMVTVTVALPYRNLVFFREGSTFVARYRLRVVQRDGRQALAAQEWDGQVELATYEETRAQSTVRRTATLRLAGAAAQAGAEGARTQPAAGPVQLEVLVEVVGTQRQGRRLLTVSPAVVQRRGVTLGDLVLYARREASPLPLSDSLAVREIDGVPDPSVFSRRDGNTFDLSTGPPWLMIAVYDLREAAVTDSQQLQVAVVVHGSTAPLWETKMPPPAGRPMGRLLVRLPARAFAFGTNDVRVVLPPQAPRVVAVENYGLDLHDDASWRANVDLVESLGDKHELEELRRTSPEQRAAAWAAFWQRRDPDPQEPGNPRLELHFARVEYARRELRDGFRDGALSDRGRVYIRYGPPESIESHGMLSSSSATFEVWHYYQQSLTFYFRDADGLGHYRLVWSEQR
jgi:GWxTD domain-containing protein